MSDRAVVFLDTETDGLDERWRQAWEIAMIRVEPDGERTSRTILVDLTDYSMADPVSLRIGRFNERHPLGRRLAARPGEPALQQILLSEQAAAGVVREMTQGATIVGAQPDFDTITLTSLLRKFYLVAPQWHYRKRDVESMTAGFLRRDVGGLQDCAKALGIESPPKDQHTAMGDALLAEKIYNRITASPLDPDGGIPFTEMVGQHVTILDTEHEPVKGLLVNVVRESNFTGGSRTTLLLDNGESYRVVPGRTLITAVPQ